MFLTSFSYYRGIAIVLIVIGHCYGLSGWTFASYPERVLANILTGGTVLFVFISGFLFHQVFYLGFDFRWFLTKKLRRVATPYLLWSTLTLVLNLLTHTPLPDRFVGSGPSLPGKGGGISFCQPAFFVVRSHLAAHARSVFCRMQHSPYPFFCQA